MNTTRTVLITGANKSIGYETARQLGRLGYPVWLGCRDVARGEAALKSLVAEGHDVRLLTIDVTRDGSVRAAAARVRDEDGRLDVLLITPAFQATLTRRPASNRWKTSVLCMRRTSSARFG